MRPKVEGVIKFKRKCINKRDSYCWPEGSRLCTFSLITFNLQWPGSARALSLSFERGEKCEHVLLENQAMVSSLSFYLKMKGENKLRCQRKVTVGPNFFLFFSPMGQQ